MIFDEIRQMALSFPGVEEHVVFGGPTFRVGKRFLACIAKIDPDTLVLKVPDILHASFYSQPNRKSIILPTIMPPLRRC